MKTFALAFVRNFAIWLAAAFITMIYLFGVSAMNVVDFVSHESFGSVYRQVIAAGTEPLDFSYHGWILAAAFISLAVYSFAKIRMRLGIAVLWVIAPWFWTTSGIKGTAQWLLLMPATPLWTVQIATSESDGEFYAEGFVIAVALGWWMILWTILGFTDFLKLRREQQILHHGLTGTAEFTRLPDRNKKADPVGFRVDV
jgi:hypothetical protein